MERVLTFDRCVRMCAIICPRNTKEPSELAPTKVTWVGLGLGLGSGLG